MNDHSKDLKTRNLREAAIAVLALKESETNQCVHGGEGRSSGFFRSFGSRKELNERFVFLASCLREMPRPSASSFVKFSK